MRTSKARILAIVALVATFVLAMSCLFITACGSPKETVAVTWTVPDGVTVEVDGASGLPDKWEKGTNLVFKVTPPTGYNVTVKTTTTLSPSDGKYTINSISRDTTVTITTEEQVTALTVEKVAGAEFVYLAGDELDKTTIVVKATFANSGEKVIESGYTVNPTLFEIGNTSFTVSYKGVTSAAVELDKAVEGREFGFTKISLEVGEDGKPYYVLQGSYSNYDAEKFNQVGFDFQENGYYSVYMGGSEGWAYVKYQTEMTEFGGGVFTLKVDMSNLVANLESTGLSAMMFIPHMGFNTPGDNSGNLNVYADNYVQGQSVKVDGIKYELYYKEYVTDGDNQLTSFDMVGVIVTNEDAPTYRNSYVSLEKDGDKVYFVINGVSSNYEKDALLTKLTENIVADYSYNTAVTGNTNGGGDHTLAFTATDDVAKTIFVEVANDGTYKVKLDISDAEEGIMFFHFSFKGLASDGTMSGLNLACALSENASDLTVTAGGLTFTAVTTESTESWAAGLAGVKVEAAA